MSCTANGPGSRPAASSISYYVIPMTVQAIGWASSLILVLTIGTQVLKQWREKSSQGISKWLFIGQTVASIGFTIYSALVGDLVFVVTNGLLLANGIAGFLILMQNRRGQARAASLAAE